MSELNFIARKLESLSQYRPLVPAVVPHAPVNCPTPSYGGQTERLKIEAVQYRQKKILDEQNSTAAELSVTQGLQAKLRRKAYQDAENQFIDHKLKMLSEEQFTKELEKNLQRTSVILLAEVTRHCVPPAASSEKVWAAMHQRHQELMKNSHKHNPP